MVTLIEPVVVGERTAPSKTLGWTALDWCSQHLTNVDGQPWVFTPEQALFVLQWYGLDDNGRWLYRRGVLRRMKGWGKDPLAAILGVFEWIGPCRFGGWRDDGEPIGRPERASWIQVAAATATQAEQNTMTLFSAIIPPWLESQERLRIGLKACWAPGRRRIQAVSNSSRGLEGARPTFVIEGETQHWVDSNGGVRLAEVIRRNLTKAPGGLARSLAITNAHMAGEGSVAERDWKARDSADLLYDSVEAPPGLDLRDDEQLRAGVAAARGDSYWLEIERIVAEFRDPAADEGLNRRFFLNQVVAGSGRWMDPSTWAAAEVDRERPEPGAKVTLGFDGSVRRDATALVGTDLETGWQWIEGIWERDWNDPDWRVPIGEVHEVVEAARERWLVTRFYADPTWWDESVSRWQARFERPDGKNVVAFWYTAGTGSIRTARAVRAFGTAVTEGLLTHEPSAIYDRHITACHKEPLKGRAGEDGLHLIRKSSRASIESMDAAMAGVLSWQACLDSRGDGDLELNAAPLKVVLPPWL